MNRLKALAAATKAHGASIIELVGFGTLAVGVGLVVSAVAAAPVSVGAGLVVAGLSGIFIAQGLEASG